MKKIYFLALALVGLSFGNAQVIIEDDFESYPLGSYFGGHWSNWSGASGAENIIISEDQAASGTKSGYIGNDGIQDAVWQFGNEYTSGTYTIQWDMYIDFASGAYTNLQEKTVIGAGNFANVIQFGSTPTTTPEVTPGVGYITGTEFYYPFNYPEETWFTVTLVVKLDEAIVELYIDGVPVETSGDPIPYAGDLGSIAAFDFYSYTADGAVTNSYYLDNMVLAQGTLSVSDINNSSNISLYPTVVKDSFTVSAKSNISEVTVFNTNGQQVMKVNPQSTSAQISVNSLPAGVYVVKTIAGKEVKTTKVVVK